LSLKGVFVTYSFTVTLFPTELSLIRMELLLDSKVGFLLSLLARMALALIDIFYDYGLFISNLLAD